MTAHGAALSDPGFAELGDIDTAVVTLRFASGALGVIDNSRSAGYGYECSTEVVGSAATVRIDNPPRHHYRWLTPGQDAVETVRDFEQRYPWAYAAELESFARAVLDGVPPAVTGTDALAAFDLARAAERSWRAGRPGARTPVAHPPTTPHRRPAAAAGAQLRARRVRSQAARPRSGGGAPAAPAGARCRPRTRAGRRTRPAPR